MRALSDLPNTELLVLGLLSEGKTNQEIADEMHLSVRTIEAAVSRLMLRLSLTNRVQLARWYLSQTAGAA